MWTGAGTEEEKEDAEEIQKKEEEAKVDEEEEEGAHPHVDDGYHVKKDGKQTLQREVSVS